MSGGTNTTKDVFNEHNTIGSHGVKAGVGKPKQVMFLQDEVVAADSITDSQVSELERALLAKNYQLTTVDEIDLTELLAAMFKHVRKSFIAGKIGEVDYELTFEYVAAAEQKSPAIVINFRNEVALAQYLKLAEEHPDIFPKCALDFCYAAMDEEDLTQFNGGELVIPLQDLRIQAIVKLLQQYPSSVFRERNELIADATQFLGLNSEDNEAYAIEEQYVKVGRNMQDLREDIERILREMQLAESELGVAITTLMDACQEEHVVKEDEDIIEISKKNYNPIPKLIMQNLNTAVVNMQQLQRGIETNNQQNINQSALNIGNSLEQIALDIGYSSKNKQTFKLVSAGLLVATATTVVAVVAWVSGGGVVATVLGAGAAFLISSAFSKKSCLESRQWQGKAMNFFTNGDKSWMNHRQFGNVQRSINNWPAFRNVAGMASR